MYRTCGPSSATSGQGSSGAPNSPSAGTARPAGSTTVTRTPSYGQKSNRAYLAPPQAQPAGRTAMSYTSGSGSTSSAHRSSPRAAAGQSVAYSSSMDSLRGPSSGGRNLRAVASSEQVSAAYHMPSSMLRGTVSSSAQAPADSPAPDSAAASRSPANAGSPTLSARRQSSTQRGTKGTSGPRSPAQHRPASPSPDSGPVRKISAQQNNLPTARSARRRGADDDGPVALARGSTSAATAVQGPPNRLRASPVAGTAVPVAAGSVGAPLRVGSPPPVSTLRLGHEVPVPAWAQPNHCGGRQNVRIRGDHARGPSQVEMPVRDQPFGALARCEDSPSASPPVLTRGVTVAGITSSPGSSGPLGSPAPCSPVPRWDEMCDVPGRTSGTPGFGQETRNQVVFPGTQSLTQSRWQLLNGITSDGSCNRRVFEEAASGATLKVEGIPVAVEEVPATSTTSPTSTVDLHGPADNNAKALDGSLQQLGRTNSAPDSLQSLLSGGGGLELSDSLSHPSLTMSTNSSKEANRPSDGSCRSRKKDHGHASPGPAASANAISTGSLLMEDRSPVTIVSPALVLGGRRAPDFVHEDQARPPGLDMTAVLEAAAVAANQTISPRSASAQKFAAPDVPEDNGPDENAPPETTATSAGQDLGDPCSSVFGGQTERVVARQISYWEERVRHKSLEGSPDVATVGSKGSLRERHSPNLQDVGQLSGRGPIVPGAGDILKARKTSSNRRVQRSTSASMARHAGAVTRRTSKQVELQRRATEDLRAMVFELGCDDSEEINQLLRSSSSETEMPETREEEDAELKWSRALDSNCKAQTKAWRKTMRVLDHCIKKRLGGSKAPVCGQCNHPCPRCNSSAMADLGGSHRPRPRSAAPQPVDIMTAAAASAPSFVAGRAGEGSKSSNSSSRHATQVPSLAQLASMDFSNSAEPLQVSGAALLSPTEPSQAHEEEPHREPDSEVLAA